MEQNNGGSPIGLLLGILSLIIAIIGGITFGVIGAGIALVLGIAAIAIGVNTKKATNGQAGTGGLVCGILGVVFGAIFAIGCVICGASVSSATGGTTSGGTWAGCVGVRCFAEQTASDLQDAIDDIDWSQFNTTN